jgi:hypothetical protein
MKFGIGQPMRRHEDLRLITGRGRYTDDVILPRMTYAFVLRSPVAHAHIKAYALPYRRFVGVLTDANARLGADVDRYSFIVVDCTTYSLPVSRRTSNLTCPATQSGLRRVDQGLHRAAVALFRVKPLTIQPGGDYVRSGSIYVKARPSHLIVWNL